MIQSRIEEYIIKTKHDLKKSQDSYFEMFKIIHNNHMNLSKENPELEFIQFITYPIIVLKVVCVYFVFALPVISLMRIWVSLLEVMFSSNEKARLRAAQQLAVHSAASLIVGDFISELTESASSIDPIQPPILEPDLIVDGGSVEQHPQHPPIDDTFGLPSESDGEPRIDHYVDPNIKSDGTQVRGHWKSHRS